MSELRQSIHDAPTAARDASRRTTARCYGKPTTHATADTGDWISTTAASIVSGLAKTAERKA